MSEPDTSRRFNAPRSEEEPMTSMAQQSHLHQPYQGYNPKSQSYLGSLYGIQPQFPGQDYWHPWSRPMYQLPPESWGFPMSLDGSSNQHDPRVCPVCREVSDTPHKKHYGALTCFSCKGFWRRAHQKSQAPQFRCKKGGNCVITPKNRRRCQKCRYDLCLRSGMKAEAVLTEDQRKIRFKHAFRRRESASARNTSQEHEEAMEDENEEEEEAIEEPNDSDVDKVLANYKRTCNQMAIDKEFTSQLIGMHTQAGSNLDRSLLQAHIQAIADQFQHFAMMSSDFRSLGASDQQKLLTRNTPLYVQYILARYFSAPDGASQVSWIILGQDQVSEDQALALKRISLTTFNRRVKLFKPGVSLNYYGEFCRRLQFPQVGLQANALLCQVILFAYDHTMDLDQLRKIAELENESLDMCRIGAEKYFGGETEMPNVPEMLAVMECMARFFAQYSQWNSDNDNGDQDNTKVLMVTALYTKYTQEEEKWLQSQLQLVQERFQSVDLGEELMKEFATYSLGVPMSKYFLPGSMAVFVERFNREMKAHPEFCNLPDDKQRLLCQQNVLNGVAMMMSKLETCKSGEEQLLYACGQMDSQIWNSDYCKIFVKDCKVKKLRLVECNMATGNLPLDLLKSFDKLVNNVGSLMKDPEMHKLLTLVVLFSEVDGKDMLEIKMLHDRYMNVLRRRQYSFANSGSCEDEERLLLGDALYSRFNSCICDVKELAMILKKL